MKTHARWLLLVAAMLAAQAGRADDFGTYGRTYPIRERDAIDAMKDAVRKKLANGGREKMLKGAQDRYLDSLSNVVTPAGIKAAQKASVRLVDLTGTVPETIKDTAGNLIVAAGTKINPLAIRPLTKSLFFIDAKDDRQIRLVLARARPNDKVILLGGSVFKAGQLLKRKVFLDVPGLHKRMKIYFLPSIVSQEGERLRVEEIAP